MANLVSHRRHQLMMPKKKPPMSHIVLAHSKQYMNNKKRKPSREYQCGASQIPSKGQVRTSHNSRVLELGRIMRTCFLRVFRLL